MTPKIVLHVAEPIKLPANYFGFVIVQSEEKNCDVFIDSTKRLKREVIRECTRLDILTGLEEWWFQ